MALALRLVWGHQTHAPTLDTAVVGLMAMDIQEGARPLFFTGQGYMGALEAYLMAGSFELFGVTRFTMCIVPAFFGALWPVLMYFFLKLDVPAKAAAAGTWFVALPAGHILWYTTVPYGGYPEMYVFGTVMLLHAAIRLKQKSYSPWKDAVLFSLFAFLGAWTNLQVFPFLATAGAVWLYLLFPDWKRPSRWLPFALVPLALALAVVPQILISAENPASPPLFSAASAKQVAYSVNALFTHDLLALMTWQGMAVRVQMWVYIPVYLTFILLGTVVAFRKPQHLSLRGLTLCGVFLLFFSLLYFPHSMSGYVPRYLIAPFVLCMAVFVSLATSAENKALSRGAHWGWLLFIGLQISAVPNAVRFRNANIQPKLATMAQVIQTARDAGLTHLRRVGSGMEGHKAAALTFEAGKNPVFTSSYDERRRDADLAWHESENAGYFFSQAYRPFVDGSLKAMGITDYEILDAGHFQVLPMPQVPFAKLAGMREIRQDLKITKTDNRLRIDFPKELWLAGLRLTAPADASLPYQYTVTDGEGTVLSSCSQRLGSSYISGDRVYFKGYEDQMDVFWPATRVSTLLFSYTPGKLNKLPIQLEDLYLFYDGGGEPGPLDTDALREWLQRNSQGRVVASDGVAGYLRRQGLDSPRLPLPWNPRDPEAQLPEFDFKIESPYLLLMENRYAAKEEGVSFGPIKGIERINASRWKRFTYE